MVTPVIFSTGFLYPFGLDRVYGWAADARYEGVEIMMDESAGIPTETPT